MYPLYKFAVFRPVNLSELNLETGLSWSWAFGQIPNIWSVSLDPFLVAYGLVGWYLDTTVIGWQLTGTGQYNIDLQQSAVC